MADRISNLRYADDTTLLSRTEAELTELLKRMMTESEKAGLYLNITKTKMMTTGEMGIVKLNGEEWRWLTVFSF